MDPKKVTAAVKIKLSLDKHDKKAQQLYQDLKRLRSSFTNEEWNEYQKRLQ